MLFQRVKPLDQILATAEKKSLKRQLGAFQLTMLGIGAIIGTVWLRLQKQDNSTPIPFGPYLAIAGWIVFMWGEQLVDGYLRISGIR